MAGAFALVNRWYYYNKKRTFVKRERRNPEPCGARRRHKEQRAASGRHGIFGAAVSFPEN